MYHYAVIDIGKTNKKIMIFDDRLTIVDSVYKSFEEYVKDGIHFEDVDNMTAWLKEQLKILAGRYHIRALSVATHGATAMCIDAQGNLAVPPVAYTTEAGEEFRQDFFSAFGSPDYLQSRTATAEVGSLINIAKKIYFLQKKFPDRFRNVTSILNYPQYIGYLFTGRIGAEHTYVGCHSYLYDFERRQWSEVAGKLGVIDKLPSAISKSWDVLGTVSPAISHQTGLPPECVVTMGIHDSNSSLLPYLVKGHKNFILNSTGTWCVAMHPTDRVGFGKDELGKLVFYNLSAFGTPVKTSIFMGGLEFETYTKLLKSLSGDRPWPEFHPALYERIVRERKLFILPSVVRGTGIFPDAQPRIVEDGKEYRLEDVQSGQAIPAFFRDFETAYAVLNISLAIQTKAALEIAGFRSGTIFTEGGFRKNDPYNRLLTSLFPGTRHALTSMQEATAFGAAILAKAALDKTTPMETAGCFDIEMLPVEPATMAEIGEYSREFFNRL